MRHLFFTREQQIRGCVVLLIGISATLCSGAFAGEAIQANLERIVDTGGSTDGSQSEARQAWQEVVSRAGPEDLSVVLAAMKGVNPLPENWLRAAVDTIAERALQRGSELPTEALEAFILDTDQSPRARRVAYEWLTKVDEDAPSRLLPNMLNDPSLELRYDAVARSLASAKLIDGEQNKREKYQQILRSARDKEHFRECAEALVALGEKPNMAEAMGFLVDWKVLGPFDNTDRNGFNKVHLAVDAIDWDAEYEGKAGPITWQDATAEQEDLEDLGKVDLNSALVEEKSVLAYAFTTFTVSEPMRVECRYDSPEATKLWVNGEQVAVHNVYHSGSELDQHVVPVQLKAGENQILLKVCQNEQTEPWTKPWEFRLRVTDKLGGAIHSSEIKK